MIGFQDLEFLLIYAVEGLNWKKNKSLVKLVKDIIEKQGKGKVSIEGNWAVSHLHKYSTSR